jgi:nitrogen fixation/metabolism regulation signal transduction histidine kinase
MGFDRSYARGLIARLGLLLAALLAFAAALLTPDLVAVRIVTAGLAAGAGYALWHHIQRTNHEVARFIDALRLGDLGAHFDRGAGSGFGALGDAFGGAIRTLRDERQAAGDELRYLETLVDDMPVALLTIDPEGRVAPGNKAARRLFTRHHGVRPEDYAVYSATLAARLGPHGSSGEEMLILNLDGRAKRALVRSATLTRLGRRSRAMIVQPVQETLNAVEMAAQTDLVRVLTHEILNSLTPVTSLAATAAGLLVEIDDGSDPRLADVRAAVSTLARRADGLGHFIDSYRAVAHEPEVSRRRFAAAPFAAELERLFRADWPAVTLALAVTPADLELDADPDLLAQVLINLLRNAGEAATTAARPAVRFDLWRLPSGEAGLEVADNGPGVPAPLRQDIFLPFFTTRKTGTGVGLNLARQIVVAHGGAIEVDDAPGGGAVFRVIL